MKRWRYESENILGNAHDAVRFINKNHPDWDVVSIPANGENGTPGSVTLVVYRTEIEDEDAEDARTATTERPLIIATFKTPEGEIKARVQRTPDGVVAKAAVTGDGLSTDWVLVRDADGTSIEWYLGSIEQNDYEVVEPNKVPLSPNRKNVLRNATRAMLAWVTP